MAGDQAGRPLRGRMVGAGLTWLLAVGVAVAAAHPDGCHPPTAAEARSAATAAVGWLGTNQQSDGAFLYRYDRDEDRQLPGYSIVRHAGVLLSLAQAHDDDIAGAEQPYRAGLDWARDHIVHTDDGAALALGQLVETGGVALLVAALVEWRQATGETDDDALLEDLGRYLVERVTAEGAVVAFYDLGTGREQADSRSPFSTGEVAWALAALHTTFPDDGWDEPALAVLDYIATQRDDIERRFPPVSDHWVAYALDEVGRNWPMDLSGDHRDLVERQAGLFGLQTRYESQRRTAGVVRWTRGPTALGAGVGTLGEGLGALNRLAAAQPEAVEDLSEINERQRCVAGLLVDRQIDGAWYSAGVTQMDDQQHALSALLAAADVLDDEEDRTR
jgi:hypothetical protein